MKESDIVLGEYGAKLAGTTIVEAVTQLSAARADAAQWRARYMAAHDVMLHVEAFIDAPIHGDDLHRWNKYTDMRASFLAYRAAIEAGAPLGWAVAEESAEVGG